MSLVWISKAIEHRGTQWICSTKYLFVWQFFAGWEIIVMICPWKELKVLLGKWQFRTVSDGIWCLEWPFSPSCFSQAVVWKFVSVVVCSGLLTFFKSTLIGLTFVFSTLSLKVMGNSVIALTCDTSDSVPGTWVFLACGDRATSGKKLTRVTI